MNNELEQFIKDLLKEAGYRDLERSLESQMIEDIKARIEDRLFFVAAENLSEEQLNEFEEISKSGNQEKISQYLNDNIENFNEKIVEAVDKFREDYLKISKTVSENLTEDIEELKKKKD